MDTPIYDFVKNYKNQKFSRFHMPGHKGKKILGVEDIDITEISGADCLFAADGIIKLSQENTSKIFGTSYTYYSTEGSTLCIKAMLGAVAEGKSGKILAGRNAHKAFIYAAASLNIEVDWAYGKSDHLCRLNITDSDIENLLKNGKYIAVYLTNPDYLGNLLDIAGIGEICRKYNVPLIVDNAHGAYLKFLKESQHPIDLGADMCCDSAHKTLPVLTGGAYLHVKNPEYCSKILKYLAFFGSTSPSYLILQSLDICNKYLDADIKEDIEKTVARIEKIKKTAKRRGFVLADTEPLKLTVNIALSGYTKQEFLKLLRKKRIEIEFCDNCFAVFMFTPKNSQKDFARLEKFFAENKGKAPLRTQIPPIIQGKKAMTLRKALLCESEKVKVSKAVGRVCAAPDCSCPPAVPIVISGETIEDGHIKAFDYYGIEEIEVVKKDKN